MSYANRMKYLMCDRILRCTDERQLQQAKIYVETCIAHTEARTEAQRDMKNYLERSGYKEELELVYVPEVKEERSFPNGVAIIGDK